MQNLKILGQNYQNICQSCESIEIKKLNEQIEGSEDSFSEKSLKEQQKKEKENTIWTDWFILLVVTLCVVFILLIFIGCQCISYKNKQKIKRNQNSIQPLNLENCLVSPKFLTQKQFQKQYPLSKDKDIICPNQVIFQNVKNKKQYLQLHLIGDQDFLYFQREEILLKKANLQQIPFLYPQISISILKSPIPVQILTQFTKKTLYSVIQEKKETGQIFTKEEILKIMKCGIQCISYLHTQKRTPLVIINPSFFYYDQEQQIWKFNYIGNNRYLQIFESTSIIKNKNLSAQTLNFQKNLLKIQPKFISETEQYLSPEQIAQYTVIKHKIFNQKVINQDPFASDIFQFGMILLHCMTLKDIKGFNSDESSLKEFLLLDHNVCDEDIMQDIFSMLFYDASLRTNIQKLQEKYNISGSNNNYINLIGKYERSSMTEIAIQDSTREGGSARNIILPKKSVRFADNNQIFDILSPVHSENSALNTSQTKNKNERKFVFNSKQNRKLKSSNFKIKASSLPSDIYYNKQEK